MMIQADGTRSIEVNTEDNPRDSWPAWTDEYVWTITEPDIESLSPVESKPSEVHDLKCC